MLAWKAGIGRERKLFDGTVAGLVRHYQVNKASPYALLKWNTRRTYDQVLAEVRQADCASTRSPSAFRRPYAFPKVFTARLRSWRMPNRQERVVRLAFSKCRHLVGILAS